jgi:hypothetical protein
LAPVSLQRVELTLQWILILIGPFAEATDSQQLQIVVDIQGDREERVFCTWMASLGVPVANLTSDLSDGLALLKVRSYGFMLR